jgi:hypothetical protein
MVISWPLKRTFLTLRYVFLRHFLLVDSQEPNEFGFDVCIIEHFRQKSNTDCLTALGRERQTPDQALGERGLSNLGGEDTAQHRGLIVSIFRSASTAGCARLPKDENGAPHA